MGRRKQFTPELNARRCGCWRVGAVLALRSLASSGAPGINSTSGKPNYGRVGIRLSQFLGLARNERRKSPG